MAVGYDPEEGLFFCQIYTLDDYGEIVVIEENSRHNEPDYCIEKVEKLIGEENPELLDKLIRAKRNG